MMRKAFLILSLVGLTVLASAGDAFAQRRGYSGGRGYAPSISINVGRGGYYSPYGYSPYYQGYGYSYAPSYYYAAPTYYTEPAYVQVRQSNYIAPSAVQQHANVTVLLPTADAQVWFDGGATKQQGMERLFHSPNLEPSHNFTYAIKARWMANGQAVTRERQVNVQAGQSVTVNFRESASENVPPPLPKLPNATPRE
jgi:uncharacterized protein (TIGR03000 family)